MKANNRPVARPKTVGEGTATVKKGQKVNISGVGDIAKIKKNFR